MIMDTLGWRGGDSLCRWYGPWIRFRTTRNSRRSRVSHDEILDFEEQLKKSQFTDTDHWASLIGQKCKLTNCGKGSDLKCDAGWAMAPNGGRIKDNCGGAGDRIVCCLSEDAPSETLLTKSSNGVPVNLVDRAMANAMRARVLCSTHTCYSRLF